LYIYYLEGCLQNTAENFGRHFIGNWEEDGYSFLFFSKPSPGIVNKIVNRQPQLTILDKYHMTYDEWQGEKLSSFQAGRFKIIPPWMNIDSDSSSPTIILDPGVVFGTGLHPTTHDCLIAIETLFQEYQPESVIDLGTGTGILSLAAAKLGAKKILAVDKNLLAVKTAYNNIRLNRMHPRIMALQGSAENLIRCSADLVIANIHYDVMRQLIDIPEFLEKKAYILSGLLRSQANSILHRLSRYPINLLKKWKQNAVWYTLLGRRC
jgi:ribosomal protein L11 methyltransferase